MHKQNTLRFKYYSKTGTLSFYCRYLSIKKSSCKCVRYNKHGIKNCTKFEYRSQTQDL